MIPLLLALALLTVPPPRSGRARLALLVPARAHAPGEPDGTSPARWLPALAGLAAGLLTATLIGGWAGIILAGLCAVLVAWGCRRLVAVAGRPAAPDPLSMAAAWDLMAACLHAGLPVADSVRAVAERLPGPAGGELRSVADRLALGAAPHVAWEVPEGSPLHRVARAARRSAHSGAALAEVAVAASTDVRATARELAAARGQRAAVLITGPLGLCFLPAFLVLGVAPVVIGLASGLARTW